MAKYMIQCPNCCSGKDDLTLIEDITISRAYVLDEETGVITEGDEVARSSESYYWCDGCGEEYREEDIIAEIDNEKD